MGLDGLGLAQGTLNSRRRMLVKMAFTRLDKDGSGEVDPEDLVGVYNASGHPDVLAGRRSEDEVLREFLDTFDVGGEKDGVVTRQEFENYYSNISASIDDDDYFELMIRNAWHISGGEGAAANSANRRVLVTAADGSQSVQEIRDDLGLKADDKAGMMARLRAQGVDASGGLSLHHGSGSTGAPGGRGVSFKHASAPPPPPVSLAATVSQRQVGGVDGAAGLLEAMKIAAAGPEAKHATGSAAANNVPRGASSAALPDPGLGYIIDRLKRELRARGGGTGFIGLQRKFRIMDDDGSKALSLAEFKKAMKEMNMNLSDSELRMLFDHFDQDSSGSIDFEEFIQGVRDPLTPRRLNLVRAAFAKLDKDGNGIVSGEEIASLYDATRHPEVISGRLTANEVLNQFLDTFDVGGVKDGMVTQQEFINYYTNLGANIDNEDYFELMIRNAWHISGGEGAAANSANRRVLVTAADGSQSVQEIRDDLGLKADDKVGMMARLRAQGVDAANVSLYGTGEDNSSKLPRVPPNFHAEGRTLGAAAMGRRASPSQTLMPPNPPQLSREEAIARMGPCSGTATNTGARPMTAPPQIFAKPSAGAGAAGTAISAPSGVNPGLQLIIDRLKRELRARGGGTGFIGLQRKFRIMDDDGSKALSLAEFKKAMKEMNMNLSDSELRMLFDHFDQDSSGSIDFEEFIQGVRDPLTPRRLNLVKMAYGKLDKDGNGIVDAAEVATMYDATRHPDVLSGSRTAEDVLTEFLDTFDVGGVKDGMVTQQEFINYYTNLGANIDNEDYFELMIRNAWHISGGEGAAANSANRRVLVTAADGSQSVQEIRDDLGLKADDKAGMMARLRAQGVNAANVSLFDGDENANKKGLGGLSKKRYSANHFRSSMPAGLLPGSGALPKAAAAGSSPHRQKRSTLEGADVGVRILIDRLKTEIRTRGGTGYIGLQRKFRIMDDDGSKALSLAEFKKAMKEMNMNLSDSELRMLFDHFDQDSSGSIDFEEFIQGVRDPLTPRRLNLVKMAFKAIDRDGSGVVDAAEVATMYDATRHPEVISGRLTANEVLNQFLDTFDVGGVKDGMVTQQEFINYYTNLGANIDNEDYFELMIRNAWHISGGEGAAANSANRRVLVTAADGSQSVQEIRDDLGLKADDKAGMMARLRAQGVDASGGLSQYGTAVDGTCAVKGRGKAPQNLGQMARLRTRDPSTIKAFAGSRTVAPDESVQSALHPPNVVPHSRGGAREVSHGIKLIIDRLKRELRARGGGTGFIGLQRKFRIMDDDGSKALSLAEFKKAMKEMNMNLSDSELRMLFDHFDQDSSGSIDFEEFIQGVRDPLTPRRLNLVKMAYGKLDKDGNGIVDAAEVATMYDATRHPDVLSGSRTAEDVLTEFLDTFDVGGVKDGMVTQQEFINYYTNLGANIDNEDYFELMIRNAWHISGGEGAAANSANRRVLVTAADGSQSVQEIRDDLGLKADDKAGMLARLRAQGSNASQISLSFGSDSSAQAEAPIMGSRKRSIKNAQWSRTSFSFEQSSSPGPKGKGKGRGSGRAGDAAVRAILLGLWHF